MLRSALRLLALTVALTLCVLGSACRSRPAQKAPSPAGVPVAFHSTQYFGSALGGELTALAASAQRAPAWTFAVEAFPDGLELPALGIALPELAAIVVDPRRADPIRAGSDHFSSWRWLGPSESTRWLAESGAGPTPRGRFEAALFAGQTLTLQWTPQGSEDFIRLSLERPLGGARGILISLSAIRAGQPVEILQSSVEWQPDSAPQCLVHANGGKEFALFLKPWTPAPGALAREASKERGRAALAPTEKILALPGHEDPLRRYLSEAMDRLRIGADRKVLFDLASELQARSAQDWFLICSDAELEELVVELGRGVGRLALADQPEQFALRLESLALRQAALQSTNPGSGGPSRSSNRDQVAQGEAFLVRHTGQLGRAPEVLLELLGLAGDLTDLAGRIVEENRIYLEDADRSARLRAFEWLQARGAAPHNYDPLSRSSQRQQALDQWREALDSAPTSPKEGSQP